MHGLQDYHNLTSVTEEILADNSDYTVTYSTHYIFTSLKFNCSGAITGWAILALDDGRGGKPEMSIWTPQGDDKYTK